MASFSSSFPTIARPLRSYPHLTSLSRTSQRRAGGEGLTSPLMRSQRRGSRQPPLNEASPLHSSVSEIETFHLTNTKLLGLSTTISPLENATASTSRSRAYSLSASRQASGSLRARVSSSSNSPSLSRARAASRHFRST